MTARLPTEEQRRRRNNDEEHEQAVVVDWLDQRGVLYTAVPNGGKRGTVTAARLKRLGTKRGVPDILIFDRPPHAKIFHGVAIEMKRRGGGKVSKEQLAWLGALDRLGWAAHVCRGADEAIAILTKLGYGSRLEIVRGPQGGKESEG